MPVAQLRRTFHTPEQINAIANSKGIVHRAPVEVSEEDKLRAKLLTLSKIAGRKRQEWQLGRIRLVDLQTASEAYLNCLKDLQALTHPVARSVQASRRSLY
jgi:hypothetical protein